MSDSSFESFTEDKVLSQCGQRALILACVLADTVTFSPILILDDSIHNLLHLLSEGQRVGRELLSGRATTFLRFLHLLVLLPPSPAAGAGRGRPAVMVAVSLALSGCLFVTHFLFDVL